MEENNNAEKKNNKKLIIIIIGVLIVIIIGLVLYIVTRPNSSPNTNKELINNKLPDPVELPEIEEDNDSSFSEELLLTIFKGSGRTGSIKFLKNNICKVDFTSYNGKVRLDANNYYTYNYPSYDEPCKYRKEGNKVKVYYNGMVSRTTYYKNGLGQPGSAPLEQFYLMRNIEFEYNEELQTLKESNGRWKVNGDENGLALIHFIENGSEEDLQEKLEDEKTRQEKEKQEREIEESRRATAKKQIDDITIDMSSSCRKWEENNETDIVGSGETISINFSNLPTSPVSIDNNTPTLKSLTINGKEYSVSNYSDSIELTANQGLNTYNVVLKNLYDYQRTITLKYTFEPQDPYITYDEFLNSCYIKMWTNFVDNYNLFQKLDFYYDDISVKDNPPSIRNQEVSDDTYYYIYSKGGTHTLKAKNKFGKVFERTFTFPEECDNKD